MSSKRTGAWSSRAAAISASSAGSLIKTIGIDGMRPATTAFPPVWLRPAAPNTYRKPSRALTNWMITANGAIRRNTAGCGARAESMPIGRLIATVIGAGFRHTAGRGFHTSRGAGRLIITGDGLTYATAGAGRRSSISTSSISTLARDTIGDGGRITWPFSDGEAITAAVIATVITTVTGRGSATGATDIWAGARCRPATGITGQMTGRLALKNSETFARGAASAAWTRAGLPEAARLSRDPC